MAHQRRPLRPPLLLPLAEQLHPLSPPRLPHTSLTSHRPNLPRLSLVLLNHRISSRCVPLPICVALSVSGPDNSTQLAAQQQAAGQPHAGRGGLALPTAAGAGAGAGGDVGIPDLPDLNALRQYLQEDPAAAQEMLQQFAMQHPQEMQALAQNPQLLEQLLGGMQPTVVALTEEDEAAIQRVRVPFKSLHLYHSPFIIYHPGDASY